MDVKRINFQGEIDDDESKITALTTFANDLGVEIFVERQLKFEDLGLVEVEKGHFQCLACRCVLLHNGLHIQFCIGT